MKVKPSVEMSKTERVIAAVKCQPADRTCYAFRAEPDTLEKLYRYLGFHDYDKLVDYLNVDIHLIDASFPKERYVDGAYQNCWGERYVYKTTPYGAVREDLDGALASARTLSDLKSFPWPQNDDVDYSQIAGKIGRHGDMAIQYGSADVWQRPCLVRGMANFMMDMVLQPEFCHYLSNVFADFYAEDYRRAQKAAGGRISIFTLYSDLGSQQAPLISRDMLKAFVLPYIRRIADVVHELNAFLFFHTCGMVYPFIEDLMDAGVDILDPIQPCQPEMQPEALAERFGGRLCLHGGIDVQRVLVSGSPQDVREEVQRYRLCFPTGYICAPTHYFQSDAPEENILAVYDETRLSSGLHAMQ